MGTGTIAVNTTDAEHDIGQRFLSPNYTCRETFLSFDTSSIPDTDDIESVVLSLYVANDGVDTNFTMEARLYDWSSGGVTSADWQDGTELGAATLLATFSTAGLTEGAYNEFTPTAAFLSNIDKTGTTYIVVSSDRQRLGITPTNAELVGIFTANEADANKHPKLVITHSTAGATTLTVQDATHSHAVDNVALTQVHSLVVQDATHSHSADNVTVLNPNLTVQGAGHTLASGNVSLEFPLIDPSLVIQDGPHAHRADELTLTQTHILTVQDGTLAHTADGVTLVVAVPLVVQDSSHVLTVDGNLVLTTEGFFAEEDGTLTWTPPFTPFGGRPPKRKIKRWLGV